MNLVKYNELENLVSGDFQANILLDLFLAGGETSATTLAWSIVHMMRHPDVQVREAIVVKKSQNWGLFPEGGGGAQPHSIAFGGVFPNIIEAILVDEISTK